MEKTYLLISATGLENKTMKAGLELVNFLSAPMTAIDAAVEEGTKIGDWYVDILFE